MKQSLDKKYLVYSSQGINVFDCLEKKLVWWSKEVEFVSYFIFDCIEESVICSGMDKFIYVFELSSGTLKSKWHTCHIEQICYLSCSLDDNLLLSCSKGGEVIVWEVKNEFKQLQRLNIHRSSVTKITFCSTQQFVYTGSQDGKINVLKRFQGMFTIEHVFQEHKGSINDLVLYEENALLFSASSDFTVIVWNLRSLEIEKILIGHSLEVNKILLDNLEQKQYLFSASNDKTIIVWDISNFQMLFTIEGHYSSIVNLTINEDSTKLFSCSEDGTIGIHPLTYNNRILNFLNFIQLNMHNNLAFHILLELLKSQCFINHNLFLLFCYFNDPFVIANYIEYFGFRKQEGAMKELLETINRLQ